MDNVEVRVSFFARPLSNQTDDKITWPWNALGVDNTNQKIEAQTYYADSLLHIVQPIGLACLPFALTYLFTFVESIYGRVSKKVGKKAPLVPYTIPIVGHSLIFALSLSRLIKKNK